ncbi:MAG: glutaredoxin domain-containing protein [Anaerobacillus sp.]
MNVIVFTSPGCKPCKDYKDWLDKEKIIYIEKTIEKYEFFLEFKKYKGKGTPLTIINDIENSYTYHGFSRLLSQKLLSL